MSTQKINDGGPAFPSHGSMGEVTCEGMTMRDYFAAKAIPTIYQVATCEAGSSLFQDPDWRIGLALDAYAMADAMLKARSQP